MNMAIWLHVSLAMQAVMCMHEVPVTIHLRSQVQRTDVLKSMVPMMVGGIHAQI